MDVGVVNTTGAAEEEVSGEVSGEEQRAVPFQHRTIDGTESTPMDDESCMFMTVTSHLRE